MVFHPLNELVAQLPSTRKLEPYYNNGIRAFELDLRLCASEMRRGKQVAELMVWAMVCGLEITRLDSGKARAPRTPSRVLTRNFELRQSFAKILTNFCRNHDA